ncbi:MAG TPA: tRNA-intron lyase [Candidatus Bathyarchaeia archaeon]|nr:tRNA-intron lyase [Candidatus Bathyarchaeia archaeon]
MDEKPIIADVSEIRARGILTKKGVEIAEKSSIDSLSQRGYGTAENEVFTLSFYEALYLHDKDLLEVKDKDGEKADFQRLLRCYETVDENAWVNYLVYRDLRSRGYVVREGFGAGIDFRIYERGAYGKDTAQYLVLSVQEGRPLPIQTLVNAVQQCQSQKKELILAVMNRRGEAVHYSVAPLTFK